jgi:glucose/mannose-6-phosphate isomerase
MTKRKLDLSDIAYCRRYDKEDMLKHINDFPELCQRAWEKALAYQLPAGYKEIDKIVVLGMGGSAISGDLLKGLIAEEATVPVLVERGYNLPHYVNNKTLVIASSYSGMTEETLSSFKQALKTDAKKLVLTTGDELKKLAEGNGVPVFSYKYESQPRAALPFSLMPLLCFLQKLGIIKAQDTEVADALVTLKELKAKLDEKATLETNGAKQIAVALFGKTAVVYGAEFTAEVAHRWKTQFNENAKNWAFHEAFSELNHNAIVGYELPSEAAGKTMVMILRSGYYHPKIKKRLIITTELLKKADIVYRYVDAPGESKLAQMLSLVLYGDYISYYLALLNGVDPTPVKNIDYLKDKLAG